MITQSIVAGTYTNIRSFYYQYKLLFKSQAEANSIISRLSMALHIDRAQLHLVASSKGTYFGPELQLVLDESNCSQTIKLVPDNEIF